METPVMLCERCEWSEVKNIPPGWITEIKYDGTRMIARKRGNDVMMINRRGYRKEDVFPEIVEDLKKIQHSFVVDGEVTCKDFVSLAHRDHTTDPWKIRMLAGLSPCTYRVFDLIELDGKDLTQLPLIERKSRLERIFHGLQRVEVVKPLPLDELIRMVESGEIEGLVAKDPNSKYEFRRSNHWKKFRKMQTEDLLVIGYEISDKPERKVKSLICRWNEKEVQVSSGLSQSELEAIADVFERAPHKKVGNRIYLQNPSFYVEVEFYRDPSSEEWFRFPKFLRFRFDK